MAEVLLISAATGAVKGILEGLLSRAKDQIKNQIKLSWGYKQDLKKLCKRLEIIHGLLADAENRKITSEAMVAWLNHLKAATCEAENVLNELASEDLRRKTELTVAYFAFLEVLLNSHIAFVLNLDTSNFRYIVGSLEPGLGGLDANILSQVVATRDKLLPPRGDSFSYSYTAYELMGTDL